MAADNGCNDLNYTAMYCHCFYSLLIPVTVLVTGERREHSPTDRAGLANREENRVEQW